MTSITQSRHPIYRSDFADWALWRRAYEAGEDFLNQHLERFSKRESNDDYVTRRKVTPIPGFAASAINDIRNSIFQRMVDVSREGGSETYQKAIQGEQGGIDLRGSSMNAFLGMELLREILVMSRAGIFVDNPDAQGRTLADSSARPYLYMYRVEDILSWKASDPADPSEFQSVLLQDRSEDYDEATGLPIGTVERKRLLWIDETTGRVNVQFFDADDNPISDPRELELTRIPFVMVDLGDSLMRQVVRHQIALLNLTSSDISYALRANFPFYVEQRDMRGAGAHLKRATSDGSAQSGDQAADDETISVGPMQGRAYDLKANQPAFIHPSAEPLKASLELQRKLEDDIRRLVNLAVQQLGSRQSAEAKREDNEGLAAGLSFIGLVLENAERKVAEHWAAYENRNPAGRDVPTIKYPDRYSLKTDSDRIAEATNLSKLMYSLPGRTVKREIAKQMVTSLLGGRVPVLTIKRIHDEIDGSPYLTSDPDTIIRAKDAGLVGDKTGSIALGFDDDEYLEAQQNHVERLKRIAEAQSAKLPGGVDPDPQSDREEKEVVQDDTFADTAGRRTRGKAR